MKRIDAKKNNPMIAEFMGYKLITPAMRRDPSTLKYSYWQKDYPEKQDVLCGEKELGYDFSYNDLMKVVDKIESLGNCIQTKLSKDMDGNYLFSIIWYQHYDSQEQRDYKSRLEAIYSAVIDFINFYNANIKEK